LFILNFIFLSIVEVLIFIINKVRFGFRIIIIRISIA